MQKKEFLHKSLTFKKNLNLLKLKTPLLVDLSF